MDSLTQGTLSKCECVSDHHDVYSKHFTSLLVIPQ